MQKLLAGYDETDIFTREVAYQMEEHDEDEPITEAKAMAIVNDNYELFGDEWNYFTENLTELLEIKAHEGNAWKVTAQGIGWRKLDGYKYTLANTATELLRAILPKTDCTISVYNYKNGYRLQVSHHDAPTGETYLVAPCALSTYENNY